MKKRILAALLAGIMLFALCACTGGESGNGATGAQTGSPVKVVITSHSNYPYREDWVAWKYVREATGADLDIISIPNTEFTTKFSLMMADPESLPDLIALPSTGGINKYAEQGAFIAIEDCEEFMPNYKKFWDSLPEEESERMLKMRRAADGKTYCAQVWGRQDTINLRAWLHRKDLFEKHNLETPETMDDLYNVAKKLKEIYPDSYPVCLRGFLGNGVDVIGASWKPYFTYGVYYDFDNDEWNYGAREDTMLQIVEYFKKMKDEGLVPPNFVNISASEWTELVQANRTFMFPQYQVQIDLLNIQANSNNPEFKIDAMMPPRANVPTGQNLLNKTNVDPCGYVICNTNDESRIQNSAQFLDWFYSDEACELLSWGKEGETFEVVGGEKRFILDDSEYVTNVYGIHSDGLVVRVDPQSILAAQSEVSRESTKFIAKYTEKEYNPKKWVSFNAEEDAIVSTIGVELDTYVQEMLFKFVLGTEPLSKWDEFVESINEIGADKLLEAYKSAYDRVK